MFGARGTDARYWSFALILQRLLSYLPKDSAYVATSWADVQAICESPTCPTSVAIHLVNNQIILGNLNSYAKNIVFHGFPLFVADGASVEIKFVNDVDSITCFESGLTFLGTSATILTGKSTNTNQVYIAAKELTAKVGYCALTLTKQGTSTATFRYNHTSGVYRNISSNTVMVQEDLWHKSEYLFEYFSKTSTEEVHALIDRAGGLTIRASYVCSTSTNRTYNLLPVIPYLLDLDTMMCVVTTPTELPLYVHGIETINKFVHDNANLSYSSAHSDLDDKVEYRNNFSAGTLMYVTSSGPVDISATGLTHTLD
jgi:hypothetical protein